MRCQIVTPLIPPVPTDGLQPATIIEWVRQFRSQQILYKQTGATYSTGVLLNSGNLLVIECSSFETSCLKLLGALIRKEHHYHPVFLFSHAISMRHLDLIMHLSPSIILGQSAITAPVITALENNKVTTFGYCRKSKYNRFSNFHM